VTMSMGTYPSRLKHGREDSITFFKLTKEVKMVLD